MALSFVAGLYAYQKPFHQFNGTEYRNFELPEDLENHWRVDLRAIDVSARPSRRLFADRTIHWRLSLRAVAMDAGLSARRSAFFAGGAAVDPRTECDRWSSRLIWKTATMRTTGLGFTQCKWASGD